MGSKKILVMMETLCILTISMLVSWLYYCTIDFQDTTIGRNWVKGAWNHCAFSNLHVSLQLSQNKMFNFKRGREYGQKGENIAECNCRSCLRPETDLYWGDGGR